MKARRIAFYVLLGLVSIAYLFAGGAKFFGIPKALEANMSLNISQGLVRTLGFFELMGAVGLWIPKFRTSAAICLMVIMIGAIGCHVSSHQEERTPAATTLFVLLTAVIALDIKNRLVIKNVNEGFEKNFPR